MDVSYHQKSNTAQTGLLTFFPNRRPNLFTLFLSQFVPKYSAFLVSAMADVVSDNAKSRIYLLKQIELLQIMYFVIYQKDLIPSFWNAFFLTNLSTVSRDPISISWTELVIIPAISPCGKYDLTSSSFVPSARSMSMIRMVEEESFPPEAQHTYAISSVNSFNNTPSSSLLLN